MDKDFYFQWHITNHCNLRCRHCYQSDFSTQADLDWNGLKAVADNILAVLKKWGKLAIINVTGGEPFLKPELFPLLEYLDKQAQVKELAVITNGTLVDKNTVAKLKTLKKLDEVKISLEGAGEELNDAIRGKGSFKQAIHAIQLLKAGKNIETTVMFTLLRKNLADALRILDLAEAQGANGVILERFIPWGRGAEIKDEVLSREEWHDFVTRLLQFLEMPFDKEIFSYKAFWVRFNPSAEFHSASGGNPGINSEGSTKAGPHLLGAPCVAADGGICIMPDAGVFPCRRFNLKIGNLLTQTLDEIYNGSPVLQDLKEKGKLKGKCRVCSIKSCKGCRALAFAVCGDYLAEDIQCFYSPK
jgi:MoaA/NifB/PqqE/SkfB family radical SAM enzyme